MGDSAAFNRFVGLRVTRDDMEKMRGDDLWNGPFKVAGIEVFYHSCTMGEEPAWLVLAKGRSLCEFSYSRWDGHGGGGEEFCYAADPYTAVEQTAANAYDRVMLEHVKLALANDGIGSGNIELVLGWTDSVRDDDVKVHRSGKTVSHGPWRLGCVADGMGADEDITNLWWNPVIETAHAGLVLEPPYGRETVPGYPVIPIRTRRESEDLAIDEWIKDRIYVRQHHPDWFKNEGPFDEAAERAQARADFDRWPHRCYDDMDGEDDE